MPSEPSVNAEQVFNEIKTNIYKDAWCVVFYKGIDTYWVIKKKMNTMVFAQLKQ